MSDIISVIGGGWSFAYVNQRKVPGLRICANEAGILVPGQVDAIVTMDRLWAEYRWASVLLKQVPFYARTGALQNYDAMQRSSKWIRPFECSNKPIQLKGPHAFSEVETVLNGNNSGVNALNLAYIKRPKQVLMFGFDMCRHPNGSPYWYPPYPWTATNGGTKPARYDQWAREFNDIAISFRAAGIEVLNVSDHSKIMAFRRVSPKEIGLGI